MGDQLDLLAKNIGSRRLKLRDVEVVDGVAVESPVPYKKGPNPLAVAAIIRRVAEWQMEQEEKKLAAEQGQTNDK